MKKLFSYLTVLAIGLIMLQSCQNDADVLTPVVGDDAVVESMALMSYEVDPVEVTEPDMSNEVMAKPKAEKGKHIALSQIFKKLNLSADQKAQLKVFQDEHRECVRLAMQTLRETEREIIQTANEQRKAIMQQVKDSIITKEVAKVQLQELAAATRSELRNNPARAIAEAVLLECRNTFISNITAILTEEQLVKWNQFLERMNPENV